MVYFTKSIKSFKWLVKAIHYVGIVMVLPTSDLKSVKLVGKEVKFPGL